MAAALPRVWFRLLVRGGSIRSRVDDVACQSALYVCGPQVIDPPFLVKSLFCKEAFPPLRVYSFFKRTRWFIFSAVRSGVLTEAGSAL